jgi:hypothetical protein
MERPNHCPDPLEVVINSILPFMHSLDFVLSVYTVPPCGHTKIRHFQADFLLHGHPLFLIKYKNDNLTLVLAGRLPKDDPYCGTPLGWQGLTAWRWRAVHRCRGYGRSASEPHWKLADKTSIFISDFLWFSYFLHKSGRRPQDL